HAHVFGAIACHLGCLPGGASRARYNVATMLLTIDIGNTNVTMGAFDGTRLSASWRTATDTQRQADEYALQLQGLLPMKGVTPASITKVAMCSVVPPLSGVFEDVVHGLF